VIRVVLVEDNRGFREAVKMVLELEPDIEVVATVDNGSDAGRVCADERPDVVLLDYRLPGLDGVQATRAIRSAVPEAGVVCLTASAEGSEIRDLLEAGVVACLTKDTDLRDIIAAIRDAADR
jgi:two-component system, NarL family, response regulator DesR